MALDAFMNLASSEAEVQTPVTPEQTQQEATTQARTEVTYDNAGQEPPTPGNVWWPHIKGGFMVWIVIVILLFLAFAAYHRAEGHGGSVVAEVKVEE